jgi:signal transduction histidine kinase
MILDASELEAVLKKVVSDGLRQAVFEANMMAQQLDVRYFGPEVDLLALYQKPQEDGGLTKAEKHFYAWKIDQAMEKLNADERKRTSKFHKMPWAEICATPGPQSMGAGSLSGEADTNPQA